MTAGVEDCLRERNVRPIARPPHGTRPIATPTLRKRVALVVGVGDYASGRGLDHSARDASVVARVLAGQLGFRVRRLLDAEANAESVHRAIRKQLAGGEEESQWLFYFAGHGEAAGPSPDARLVLHAEVPLSLSRLVDDCIASRHRQTLLILDACHSGGALVRPEALAELRHGDAAGHRRVRQIVCAGNAEQTVLDGGGRGHSVFTQVLLEALIGWLAVPHGRDPRTIAFRDLMVALQNEVEARLTRLGVPESRRQDTVGGNLVGTSDPLGFELHHPAPWLTPDCVERARSGDASERLRALVECVDQVLDHPDRLPMAAELAFRSVPSDSGAVHARSGVPLSAVTDPGAGEREQAARTLGRLAALATEHGTADRALAGPLLRLAVKDPAARVRYRARAALRRCSEPTRRSVARAAAALTRHSAHPERRRARHAVASLPEARSTLSPGRRGVSAITCVGLHWLQAWRVTSEKRSVRLVLALLGFGVLVLYIYLFSTWHSGIDGDRVTIRRGHPGLTGLPWVGEPIVVTEIPASDLRDPNLVREGRIRGTWISLGRGGTPWAPGLLGQLEPAEAGLAGWRLGRTGEAIARLKRAAAGGDSEPVRVAAYLGLPSGSELPPLLGVIDTARSGDARMVEAFRSAMRALAIARPGDVPASDDDTGTDDSRGKDETRPEGALPREEAVDVEDLLAVTGDLTSVGRADALARLVDCWIRSDCTGDRLTGTLLVASRDPDPWVRREAHLGILFLHPVLPKLERPKRLHIAIEDVIEAMTTAWPKSGIDRGRFARRLARSPARSRTAVFETLMDRAGHPDPQVSTATRLTAAELIETEPTLLRDAAGVAAERRRTALDDPSDTRLFLRSLTSELPRSALQTVVTELLASAEDVATPPVLSTARASVAAHLAARDPQLSLAAAQTLSRLAGRDAPRLRLEQLQSQDLLLQHHPSLSDLVIPDLLRDLASENRELREAALRVASEAGGVGETGPSTMVSAALRFLNEPDPVLRTLAARTITRWGQELDGPEAKIRRARSLAEALTAEDDPTARIELAVGLGILAGNDRRILSRAWRALDATTGSAGALDADTEIRAAGRIGRGNPEAGEAALRRLARHLDRDQETVLHALSSMFVVANSDRSTAEIALTILEPRLADSSWKSRFDGMMNCVLPLCRLHPGLAERGVDILRTVLTTPTPLSPDLSARRRTHLLSAAYDGLVELAGLLTGDDLDAVWRWTTSLDPLDRRVGRDLLVRLAARHPGCSAEIQRRLAALATTPAPVDRIAVARAREVVGLLALGSTRRAADLDERDWQWLLDWIPDRAVSDTLRELARPDGP